MNNEEMELVVREMVEDSRDIVPITPAEIERIKQKFVLYEGHFDSFSNAIGALFITRLIGWKVALIVYDPGTIKRYEKELGVSFREGVPEVGPLARKSVAWKVASKLRDVWRAVTRNESVKDRKRLDLGLETQEPVP